MDGEIVSRIGPGLLALVGVREGDTEDDAEYIARKLLGTRLWQGSSGAAGEGKAWSESVVQRGYELLCVSQFTLHARLKGYVGGWVLVAAAVDECMTEGATHVHCNGWNQSLIAAALPPGRNKPDFCKAMSPQAVSCGARRPSVPLLGRRLMHPIHRAPPACC